MGFLCGVSFVFPRQLNDIFLETFYIGIIVNVQMLSTEVELLARWRQAETCSRIPLGKSIEEDVGPTHCAKPASYSEANEGVDGG